MDENKKKHYKSFTAPTRKEAEFLALQWRNNKEAEISDITVYDAVTRILIQSAGSYRQARSEPTREHKETTLAESLEHCT